MISIVMASTLSDYPNAARFRERKILRAAKSLESQIDNEGQPFTDYELIVVSDGCDKTVKLMKPHADQLIKIPKQKLWSGTPRNTGIEAAKGEIIIYLDNDDAFVPFHLAYIAENWNGDSLLMGDMIPKFNSFTYIHELDFRMFNFRGVAQKLGYCGTSNIAHTKDYKWKEKGDYAHDWQFIKQFKNIKTVRYGGYMVCHVPRTYDI